MNYNTPPLSSGNEWLILYLIKEDIKSNQLINGFSNMLIDASAYILDLHVLVFHLMGFNPRLDSIYEEYFEFMRKIPPFTEESSPIDVDRLAHELYAKLLKVKRSMDE
ncbi:MAG: hypothetical protein MI674_02050 [Cytophagales bacterium]|nr:hypothetical protein [Cytophagales bacterium]